MLYCDRSFPAFYGDPRTREAALAQLGQMVRRVHELPLPHEADLRDQREFLATIWSGPVAHFALPAFVGDAVRGVLTEDAPASERALVLSHNDVNPTNLVYDGEHLLLLDWDTAGPNDPFYDLAAVSVFLRMDEGTCQRLLTAYDGEPVSNLPARFVYNRRLVAVLCGVAFLHLARQSGHAGATGEETLGSTPSLGDFYQRMRAGSLNIATGEGQWWFGLALVRGVFLCLKLSQHQAITSTTSTSGCHTEDTERNTMRLLHTGKPKQVRFDRMLLRSRQPGWQAEAIELIGTEPISSSTPEIFPSDHFGLVSRLRWQA